MGIQKACVFLVDDNAVNLNTGKTVLQEKYTVITIPSGEKLIQSLKNFTPDLVLLDIDMPGMNGYDAIKAMKSNAATADIPVIFLTGKNDVENELIGLSLGAVDYITKPFSRPILIKRVELHLMLQAQKNELREFNGNLIGQINEQMKDITVLQNALFMWASDVIEFLDEEAGHHVERIQKYLDILINAMKQSGPYSSEISKWDIEAFLKSASLHDTGKIKLRDDVILKQTRISDEELIEIKLQSLYGKKLIESLQEKIPKHALLEYAKLLARKYYERPGGRPANNLNSEEIPLQARLMAIADNYDTLITEMPEKKALSHDEAIKVISENRGTQFDPSLVDLFLSLSDKIKEAVK
ncbi:MAG: response regulator [Clostridiales bacterium]|jgi:putative two-component system response regulator|nr:response regulator [Clostridiales bacterium]